MHQAADTLLSLSLSTEAAETSLISVTLVVTRHEAHCVMCDADLMSRVSRCSELMLVSVTQDLALSRSHTAGVVSSVSGPVLTRAALGPPAQPAPSPARSERWRPECSLRMRHILLALRCVAGVSPGPLAGAGGRHTLPSQDGLSTQIIPVCQYSVSQACPPLMSADPDDEALVTIPRC